MKESNSPFNIESIKIPSIKDGICQRCLSTSERHLKDIYGRSVCLDCTSFGQSTSDKFIYRKDRSIKQVKHVLSNPYRLTKIQESGSNFCLGCIKDRVNGYLEAVCGAGKTEMLYEGILHSLNNNQRVCLAIPRKQVVIELYHRLKSVFSKTNIKMLHGESKNDDGAHIIVTTIHQLIHYFQEFDLIIIDEFDAFPFVNNPLLHRFIKKAMKPSAVLFIMSATKLPISDFDFDISTMRKHFIYERFHGHELDIPKTMMIRNLRNKIKNQILPSNIIKLIKRWILEMNYVFLFVPTINDGLLLKKLFNQIGFNTELFTSFTEYKAEVLKQFKNRKINVLISTSILERGVTYPKLNVLVMFSDNDIFTKDMLVQISGRVGRKIDYPTGEIFFASETKSNAMNAAIKHINEMNDERAKYCEM